MTALNAYIRLSLATMDKNVAEVMLELKEVLLETIRVETQPQIQFLEEIIKLPKRIDRLTLLESLFQNTENELNTKTTYAQNDTNIHNFTINEPSFLQLYFATNQLLEDMEYENIFDVRLLARMVIIREEVRLFEQEYNYIALSKIRTSSINQNVPKK